jgi:hypothetical protein
MLKERFYMLHQSTLDNLEGVKLNARFVFLLMCLRADAATGVYWGCSDSIAEQCNDEITTRVAQEILAKLQKKGMILRLRADSKRGRYRIALEGYECTVGANKDRRVCLEKSGNGTNGHVAYTDAKGNTREAECVEPNETNSVAATVPVSVNASSVSVTRHPMTERANELFLKLGKKTGEHQLRELDEYLAKNDYVAEFLEEIIAYVSGNADYWDDAVGSIRDLVWSLNSAGDRGLVVQFSELKPYKLAAYRKALKKKLAA